MKQKKTSIRSFRKFRNLNEYIKRHPLQGNYLGGVLVEKPTYSNGYGRGTVWTFVYKINGNERRVNIEIDQGYGFDRKMYARNLSEKLTRELANDFVSYLKGLIQDIRIPPSGL